MVNPLLKSNIPIMTEELTKSVGHKIEAIRKKFILKYEKRWIESGVYLPTCLSFFILIKQKIHFLKKCFIF